MFDVYDIAGIRQIKIIMGNCSIGTNRWDNMTNLITHRKIDEKWWILWNDKVIEGEVVVVYFVWIYNRLNITVTPIKDKAVKFIELDKLILNTIWQ